MIPVCVHPSASKSTDDKPTSHRQTSSCCFPSGATSSSNTDTFPLGRRPLLRPSSLVELELPFPGRGGPDLSPRRPPQPRFPVETFDGCKIHSSCDPPPRRQQGPQLGRRTMKKAGTIHMSLQRRPSPERQTTLSNSIRTDHHVACLRALLAVAIKVGGQAIYQRRPSPHLGQSSPLLQWAGERGGALTTAGAAYHDLSDGSIPSLSPESSPLARGTRPIFSLSSVLLHCDSVGAHESKPWTRQVTLVGKVWSIPL